VSTQVLVHFEDEASPEIEPQGILPGSNRVAKRARILAFPKAGDHAARRRSRRRNCLMGVMVGLGLEVVTGLSAVGAWQLWHWVR
jgi:hypothetical protein